MKSLAILIIASVLITSTFSENSTNYTTGCNSTNCVQCDATNTNCINCSNNFLLGYNTSNASVWCVDPVNTLDCIAATATNSSGCTSCNPTNPASGFYPNDASTNLTGCAPCSTTNCSICSANYATCTACNDNYLLTTNGSCLYQDALNCGGGLNLTGCTNCYAGQGLETNWESTGLTACVPCNTTNCSICLANYSVCNTCSSGYLLTSSNTCFAISNLNCNPPTNVNQNGCAACAADTGFQFNFNSTGLTACSTCNVTNCGNCSLNYALCNDAGCAPGYFLLLNSNGTGLNHSFCQNAIAFGLNCTTGIIQDGLGCNYLSCNGTTGLIPFTTAPYLTCTNCSDGNCATCNLNYTVCNVCNANYLVVPSNSTCLALSTLNCNGNIPTGCTNCSSGSGLSNNWEGSGLTACLACAAGNCAVCYNDSAFCTDCNSGYVLYDTQTTPGCVSCSTLNCSAGGTCGSDGCSTCPTGAYLSLNPAYELDYCPSCPDNCTACSSSTFCTDCMNGYQLNSNGSTQTCLQYSCPSNCITCTSSTVCTNCTNGYQLNSTQTCVATCPANCIDCTSPTACTNCTTGYKILSTSNQTCVPNGSARIALGLISTISIMIYMLL